MLWYPRVGWPTYKANPELSQNFRPSGRRLPHVAPSSSHPYCPGKTAFRLWNSGPLLTRVYDSDMEGITWNNEHRMLLDYNSRSQLRPCDSPSYTIARSTTSKMQPFEYSSNPSRVIFGSGSVDKVPEEIKRLGASSPLLLSTPSGSERTDKLNEILKTADMEPAAVLNIAVMHTPVSVTLEAMDFLKSRTVDCIVSIGGGSAIGLGKALAFRTGLPHLCLPTTYSGSEMTPILGETDQGNKVTRSDPKILPAVVIYDADLTTTLPPAICTTSGINAIAHAVEALYAKNANPITSMLALEGIKALAEVLPQIVQEGSSKSLREHALYGAWLCGTCLGNSTMAIHHKLCHMLGGSFGLPHSETHTILLPHSLAYNAPAVPEQMKKLAEALPGSDGDALKGLNLLLEKTNARRALGDFGFKEGDIDGAVEKAMSAQYPNPRALEKEGLRKLLYRAWAGKPARADLE